MVSNYFNKCNSTTNLTSKEEKKWEQEKERNTVWEAKGREDRVRGRRKRRQSERQKEEKTEWEENRNRESEWGAQKVSGKTKVINSNDRESKLLITRNRQTNNLYLSLSLPFAVFLSPQEQREQKRHSRNNINGSAFYVTTLQKVIHRTGYHRTGKKTVQKVIHRTG